MSGRWTHQYCTNCWCEQEGYSTDDGWAVRPPTMIVKPTGAFVVAVCCRCGNWTTSGIFVRADPDDLACGGMHGDDEPDYDDTRDPEDVMADAISRLATQMKPMARDIGWSTKVQTINSPLLGGTDADQRHADEG